MNETDEQAIRELAHKQGVTHFSTGIAIFEDDTLLVVRRQINDSLGGLYELPGGGVDEVETFMNSAIRETLEETGLKIAEVRGTFNGFDYPTRTKPKVRQINFIVSVEPGPIKLEPTEHDHHLWITRSDVADLTTSDKMKQCLLDAFTANNL